MDSVNFVFLNSISKEIKTMEDVLINERLKKYLWIEFILNPALVKIAESYPTVNDSLTDALSWYLAFRWLFPTNEMLEDLNEKKAFMPYRITDDIYRRWSRVFLKGLLHAGLC